MKKIKIEVEETLKYRHEVVFQLQGICSDDVIENILDDAQGRADTLDDVVANLRKKGIEVYSVSEQDRSSPNDIDVEIDYYDEVTE